MGKDRLGKKGKANGEGGLRDIRGNAGNVGKQVINNESAEGAGKGSMKLVQMAEKQARMLVQSNLVEFGACAKSAGCLRRLSEKMSRG